MACGRCGLVLPGAAARKPVFKMADERQVVDGLTAVSRREQAQQAKDVMTNETLRRIADRMEIQECLARYARGVDRGDWSLVRSSYHADAQDHHGDYRGDIDGLIDWLDERFAGVTNSTHFLGNCLIEFAGSDLAFVETYFASRRLRPPTASERVTLQPGDQLCRETWGRYADHFERRDGQWRVADRIVVIEQGYTSIAIGGERPAQSPSAWACRDATDPSYLSRQRLIDKAAGKQSLTGSP